MSYIKVKSSDVVEMCDVVKEAAIKFRQILVQEFLIQQQKRWIVKTFKLNPATNAGFKKFSKSERYLIYSETFDAEEDAEVLKEISLLSDYIFLSVHNFVFLKKWQKIGEMQKDFERKNYENNVQNSGSK